MAARASLDDSGSGFVSLISTPPRAILALSRGDVSAELRGLPKSFGGETAH
jgi:hypothetical protein